MIDNRGKSSGSAAAAVSPNQPVLLYDAANLPAADTLEPGWSGSMNEIEQNKRKRNGSFDSVGINDITLAHAQVDQEIICSPSASSDIMRRPGRKPLTENVFDDDDEDPKAKRKVQNRAAQRAFRERKERYVRDLEMKIRQLQNAHLQQTTQLSQENQYLRSVIQQLKSELCALKGLPNDNYAGDMLPTISPWQQTIPPSTDLAPFLTMGSHPPSSPAVIAPRPRPVAIAPACTPPSATPPQPVPRRPVIKKRPVAIAPQKLDKKPVHSDHQQQINQPAPYLPDTNATSSSSSHAALYVQFSPHEGPQDNFSIRHNAISSSTEPYLTSESLYSGNDPILFTSSSGNQGHDNSTCGSSSGSHGSRSPPAPSPAPIVSQKQTPEKAAVMEDESETTRIQTVWRRLNLYGRFTDFNFDQLCRVAQMADHSNGPPLAMTDGRAPPLMEDWELDKLMHTIDPDHL
ncbi:hypothetical protein BJV82DRAFT_590087 [Fennellomyces sp. T-0311]|nr:hypothetical protein BJV82DRAFT_590087 [Fennellomyces sp. T-0311]